MFALCSRPCESRVQALPSHTFRLHGDVRLNPCIQPTTLCIQVAAAYVAMGLLPASRAAHTYLPSHFASRHRGRLPLQGGASLTKEILVLEFDPLSP